MMVTERRPILLANGRILDPSRDLDIHGDLLLADGVIREAKRGIGAAGVPEGTEVIDCKGKVVAPGLDRHARLRRRARRGISRDHRLGEPGRRRRRRHHHRVPARHLAGDRRSRHRRLRPAPGARHLDRARAADGGAHQGLRGDEMAEIGLLKAAGAIAFTQGAKSVTNAQVMRRALTYARDFDALIVHHTEDPDIVGEGVMNEGEFAARARPHGRTHGGRNHHARARHAPGCADRKPLSRRLLTCAEALEVLRRAKEQGLQVTASASINHLTLNEIDVGPYRTFLKLSPPLRAEDDRTALVAALASGLIDVVDVRPQSAGRGRQAPAVRRGEPGRHRASRPCSPPACASSTARELPLTTLIKAMSSRPARDPRPRRRNAATGQPGGRHRDRSSTRPGCSIPPSSSRNARTRRSTRRSCRDAWCAPSWPAGPCTNTSEAARPHGSIDRPHC